MTITALCLHQYDSTTLHNGHNKHYISLWSQSHHMTHLLTMTALHLHHYNNLKLQQILHWLQQIATNIIHITWQQTLPVATNSNKHMHYLFFLLP